MFFGGSPEAYIHSDIQVFSRAACYFFYLCGSIAMQINPESYKFTTADRLRIERLKYQIESDPKLETLEEFMTRLFPDFDLAGLLELVDQVMAPTTTLPIDRVVEYDSLNQTLHFEFWNSATVELEMVGFERTFFWDNGDLFVEHQYCLLPGTFQGKGLIKPIFQLSLQQYVSMGVRKIVVHAGLGGGGYAWAQHGFVAIDKDEVEIILQDARNRLSVKEIRPVELIFVKYFQDHPQGTEFPMIAWSGQPGMRDILRGSDWHGELDLHNPEQFRNFSNYVFRS